MNEFKINQTRSQPLMLVLVFLAVVGLSKILLIASGILSIPLLLPWQVAYIRLVSMFISFPFAMTCVVWLASRSGCTSESTWSVPLALIVATTMIELSGFMLIAGMLIPLKDMFHFFWMQSIRSEWISYVFLAFLFQVTSLHLRLVEAESSPRRLTVFSILSLTTIGAIGFVIDTAMIRPPIGQAPRGLNLSSQSNLMLTFFSSLTMAIVWFSTAWLFVANNPKRWLGVIGLFVYVIFLGVYFFVIVPETIRQWNQARGPVMIVMQSQFLWQFGISVFQIAIVFSCVGMMHVAGYRWDILRRLPKERIKTGEAFGSLPDFSERTDQGECDSRLELP